MKHMKKSLFFTTVMMVVLLVVALSTATFAWYTSSNTVTIAKTTVNSAEASGANIAIGWANNAPIGANNITFKENTKPINPMVPNIGSGTNEQYSTTDFDLYDTFLTANLSNGKLPDPSETTDYYQAVSNAEEETFYVINYSSRGTNIAFTSSITGENADRLKLAIFRVSDGVCVYTNAVSYSGTVTPSVPKNYSAALTAQPDGWNEYFKNTIAESGNPAFSTDNSDVTTPVAVEAVAPDFVRNKFYASTEIGKDSPVALTDQPDDWYTNYAAYSSTSNVFTAVTGVAPNFEHYIAGDGATAEGFNRAPYLTEHTVYQLVPKQSALLKIDDAKIPVKNIQTNLIQSDGITGIYEGFTVRAWFDGPTQVDAFGGLDASFTITATSYPTAG